MFLYIFNTFAAFRLSVIGWLNSTFEKTLSFSEKSSEFFCGSRPQEWEISGGKNITYVF